MPIIVDDNDPLYSTILLYKGLRERNAFLEDQGVKLIAQIDQLQKAKNDPPAPEPQWFTTYRAVLAAGQYAAYLAIPYKFSGEYKNDKAFDCSSFMQSIYGFGGIKLPRTSKDQAKAGSKIASLDKARQGDLICFDYSSRNGAETDHIGMYVGDNKILHTNAPDQPIRIQSISASMKEDIVEIRRVIPG